MDSQPKTLQQATVYFADPQNCVDFLVARRWPDGVVKCPLCGREGAKYIPARRVWQCKTRHPGSQFSIKVGTIFEDSALPIDKWLMAMWMVANCRNGVSSHEIMRTIGVTQKSAWHMLHRIRLAMKDEPESKMGGKDNEPIEVDESFVGGKVKNMHRKKVHAMRRENAENAKDGLDTTYKDNKVPVMGIFDRESRQVRAKVIADVKRETLQAEILRNIEHGSKVFTDSARAYDLMRYDGYIHKAVNHAERYVQGQVHTNSLENFWSLMKRNLSGTYVAVEPFHLDRYLDEQMFRFNNRIGHSDATRFDKLVSQIVGRRLTYAELTGKESGERAN